jgi:hypothetical protein
MNIINSRQHIMSVQDLKRIEYITKIEGSGERERERERVSYFPLI